MATTNTEDSSLASSVQGQKRRTCGDVTVLPENSDKPPPPGLGGSEDGNGGKRNKKRKILSESFPVTYGKHCSKCIDAGQLCMWNMQPKKETCDRCFSRHMQCSAKETIKDLRRGKRGEKVAELVAEQSTASSGSGPRGAPTAEQAYTDNPINLSNGDTVSIAERDQPFYQDHMQLVTNQFLQLGGLMQEQMNRFDRLEKLVESYGQQMDHLAERVKFLEERSFV